MPGGFATSATLRGAADLSRGGLVAAKYDIGAKIEFLISAVNVLSENMSAINLALNSAADTLDGASLFSSFSAAGISSLPEIGNLA
jgi:hypothetical protein